MSLPGALPTLLSDFLQTVLWDGEGWMHVAIKTELGAWKNDWYLWPENGTAAIKWMVSKTHGNDVYFSPTLYTEPHAAKVNANPAQIALWCDLDAALPEQFDEVISPPVQMETSPGRWQAIWPLDQLTPAETVEEINKRIARSLQGREDVEAGWALGKMLRVPHTYNYKPEYQKPGEQPWQVRLAVCSPQRAPIELFAALPEVEGSAIHGSFMPPVADDLPHGGDFDALMEGRRLSADSYELVYSTPTGADWSRAFWRLLMNLFDEGFNAHEVFLIAMNAKSNKFVRDGRPPHNTWIDVLRAERAHGEQLGTILRTPHITIKAKDPDANGQSAHPAVAVALREQETVGVPQFIDSAAVATLRQRDSFVKAYADWAEKQTDAPRAYHEAWGFLLLSCVLSGHVRISTSFGLMLPNLWLMVLADTTITRKSTAEGIALKLMKDVNEDIVVATESSIEGLLTSLSARAKQPSLFSRDEITGLVDGMARKDYMAGMMEAFCKLYDGDQIKRVLRHETIDVRDPVFLFYGGGIKDKMQNILTDEHVTSGFIPRFLVITAESRHENRRPLGRWQPELTDEREQLIRRLETLSKQYVPQANTVTVGGVTTTGQVPPIVADLTDEAWETYNMVETAYVEMALSSAHPDLNVPTMDRYSKHLLKLATLCAAEQRGGPEGLLLEVTNDDLLFALSYLQGWADNVLRLLQGIGKTAQERMVNRAYKMVVRGGSEGATRAQIMRALRLSAFEADIIFKTLDQRDLVEMSGKGRLKATTTQWDT